VGLADEEASNDEGSSILPAVGGLDLSIDDEMKSANKTDEPEVDDGDHLYDASYRGDPYDELGVPNDDVAAELV
jgi:hypothetical protein